MRSHCICLVLVYQVETTNSLPDANKDTILEITHVLDQEINMC